MVKSVFLHSGFPNRKAGHSFTLVELLVVISIIGLLAGLGFPAIQGAIKSGRRAEVASLAETIKTSLNAFYAEYSAYPVDKQGKVFTKTSTDFIEVMCSSNTNGGNYRGISFLEVSPKFTNSTDGLVSPVGFLPARRQSNFFILVDTLNAGYVNPQTISGTLTNTNVPASIAVWIVDPDNSKKAVGTFK